MKKNKTLWIVVAAVVVLAAAAALCLLLRDKGEPSAAETSGTATTVSRATMTWPAATKTGAKTAATTNAAEIKTAPQTTQAAIASESECRSIGIGGGGFYYAIGFKTGDEDMQGLVESGLRTLEESRRLDGISSDWFLHKVYPRDTKRNLFGHANNDLVRNLKENGLNIGVLDGNAPAASFENGQAVGYEIDVAKACFEHFGIKLKFVAVTAENAAEKLKSGAVGLIWGGLRDGSVKGIDYSEMNVWNLENEMCYYTIGGSRYKGETALLEETEKLGVVKGTLCADFIQDRLKTADYDVKITEFATARDAFAALKSDTVDCVACDYLSAYAMWKQG